MSVQTKRDRDAAIAEHDHQVEGELAALTADNEKLFHENGRLGAELEDANYLLKGAREALETAKAELALAAIPVGAQRAALVIAEGAAQWADDTDECHFCGNTHNEDCPVLAYEQAKAAVGTQSEGAESAMLEKIINAATIVMFDEEGDARDWPLQNFDDLEQLKIALRAAGRAPPGRKRVYACSVCGDNISPDEGVYGDKCPPCEKDPTGRSNFAAESPLG